MAIILVADQSSYLKAETVGGQHEKELWSCNRKKMIIMTRSASKKEIKHD
jgi:hypothetical protein